MPPAKDWLEPRTHPDYGPVLDVAVIGAGMSGLAAAFALKCLAVRSLRMFDRSPEGFEGPWATYARMETLRSPPELTGPGIRLLQPHLPRLVRGAVRPRRLGSRSHRIPRLQWMDYLRWYRRMIDVPIENETELTDISGDGEFVVLTLRSRAGTRKIAARRVVLANGRDGLGGPYTPPMFRGLDQRYVRAFGRRHRFRCAARQDCRRDRRRRLGGRQRRRSAGAWRRARRHAGAPAGRAAHQQGHGHRQRRLLGRLPSRSPMRRNGRS